MKKKILIKISGESLQGEKDHGIDSSFMKKLAQDIKEIHDKNIAIAIVLGAGNIFRGIAGAENGMERTAGDYMGMLGTIINGIAMQDALEGIGCETRLMSALDIPEVGEKYIKRKGVRHMEKGRIVICVAGTGNPYFTTDTAGVLRALELECDIMIKATKVDGVYDKDPKKYTDAILIEHASYESVIKNDIKVMDQTGIALAKEGNLKLKVVNLYKKGAILRACLDEKEGTTIG
ncbi:UMP kinase [Candidatus Gracilibacteria bacterium]|nr:UMP kinase [Candidatus Gracilibacteria bacterium]NUJ98745.1 UMP kinase [Candidatus Gracilibacteria bacterium]